MRKYIVSSFITALVVAVGLIIATHTSDQAARLIGTSSAADVTELAENPELVAALQTKIATDNPDRIVQGDKGDTGGSGPRGTIGAAGTSGSDGQAGTSGATGSDGLNGLKGDKGDTGARGATGATGPTGAQGVQGPVGPQGATGAAGTNGQDGTSYAISGQGLEVNSNTLSLELEGSTLTNSANGLRINSVMSSQWDSAYGWGNHSSAGYAKLAGQSGGQTLVGGTAANNTLKLQGNSASTGNTDTDAAIQFLVGNSGNTTAMTILNNGNLGFGTTANYGRLNINGTMVTTSEGDIFKQYDNSTGVSYPVFARYWDTSSSDYDGGTFLFGSGSNSWVGIEKPGGTNVSRFRVRATTSSFSGNIAITTDGSNAITPFQFIQVTGLGDDPKITTFQGSTFPTTDWNPAVVGFSTGGTCGSNWSNGTLVGFKFYWDNNGGNWRLNIDQSGPNDGCNAVQVMFVRKELSNRTGYGF